MSTRNFLPYILLAVIAMSAPMVAAERGGARSRQSAVRKVLEH